MDAEQITGWLGRKGLTLLNYLPQLLLALLVLWVGMRLINMATRVVRRGLDGRDVDPTLQRFLSSLVGWGLKILLFISVIQMMGVATTSFVALIGAAGLAVGLALQGTLANFAGGVLILLFRPYKVGDIIEAQGHAGEVKEIQIFTTVLLTTDSRTVIIPNGPMANGNIVNQSSEGRLRVELPVHISDRSDMEKARAVLMKAMEGHPHVLPAPAPSVVVTGLTPEGLQLSVRPWCEPQNFWGVRGDVLERCQRLLVEAGIPMPVQLLDVRMNDQNR